MASASCKIQVVILEMRALKCLAAFHGLFEFFQLILIIGPIFRCHFKGPGSSEKGHFKLAVHIITFSEGVEYMGGIFEARGFFCKGQCFFRIPVGFEFTGGKKPCKVV